MDRMPPDIGTSFILCEVIDFYLMSIVYVYVCE